MQDKRAARSAHIISASIEELLTKQQITLQPMNAPRQSLTFKQLSIYYGEKNLILPNGEINGRINSILDVFKTNPAATIPDLVELTGKSQRSISRELKEYQEAGVLRREGARKNGRWVVV